MKVLERKYTLDELLPYDMIATKKWLSFMGLSLHSIDNALKSKKLVMQTTGVYARTGVPVTWQGVVCSLQRMSEQAVHVGGLSALEMLGFGQYISDKNTGSVKTQGQVFQKHRVRSFHTTFSFIVFNYPAYC